MQKLFPEYYGQKVILKDHDYLIDFDPDDFHKTVGAEKLTYDEYLDIQMKSSHEVRVYFKICYYNIPLGFKGRIERRTKNNICFKRIFVEGMFPDGVCFDGKEEHVWMSNTEFEEYKIGDCVSFFAEVYRYVKTSNGKQIDLHSEILRILKESSHTNCHPIKNCFCRKYPESYVITAT